MENTKRLARPSTEELAAVRAVDPEQLAEKSGLALRTIARIVTGLEVQRSSVRVAVLAATELASERRMRAPNATHAMGGKRVR